MKLNLVLAAAAVMAVSSQAINSIAASAAPRYLTAALADAGRPAADKERDADRKPAATLLFAGIKPNDRVVELVPGGGYFTRLLSKAVGRGGKIYAVAPAPRADAPAGAPDRNAPLKAIAADVNYPNVTVLVQPLKSLELPARVDVVWTSQNYHDVHNVPTIDLLAFNKAIFDALKPGGVYLVIDHVAASDAAADVTSKLHRINPEIVKQEVLAAGFVLEAQSDLLHNANDPHSATVIDPAVRGKTDQFMFKFRKPKT